MASLGVFRIVKGEEQQRVATATMDHSDREPWKDAASCEKRRDKHPLSNAFHPKAHCGESPRIRRLLSSAVGKPPTVYKNRFAIVRSG